MRRRKTQPMRPPPARVEVAVVGSGYGCLSAASTMASGGSGAAVGGGDLV